MIVLDLSILNQKGTPMFYSDLTANRPTAGIVGRIFIATDSPYGVFRDNGTTWDQVAGSGGGGGITGSGVATRVAFWDSTSSISSNANLYWDNTNSRLGINTATPGVPLDVHGSGTNAQFNGTGTNNAFLVFQNAGTSKWQIGNVYSTGSNYFRIYDVVNSSERVKVANDGQIATLTNLTLSGSPIGYSGIYNSTTATIPAATIFPSLGYVYGSINGFSSQSFGGNATYQNNNVNASIFGLNRIDFSAAGGTITMTQATGVRAMSSASFQMQYAGTNSGTITHMAGTEILGFYRSAGTGTLAVTNAYGLIINNIDDYASGFTYTNRWGIFQQGSSDNNYFAGKIITGSSTTVSTYQLDVTGTVRFTGTTTAAAVNGTTALFTGNAAFGSTTIGIGGSGGFGGGASYWLEVISSNLTLNATNSIEFIGASSPNLSYTGNNSAISQRNATQGYSAGITGYHNQYKCILNATGNGFANTMYVRGYFVDSGTLTPNSTTLIPIGFENVSGTNLFNSTSGSTLFGAQYGSLNASAKVQIDSTTLGFLPPRMTTTQKNAISTPAAGLIVFDTTLSKLCVYSGSAWQTITSV